MSLLDRFYTHTTKPQSLQKSPGFGSCFKSRLTDIHETFGKPGPSFEQGLVKYLFHVEPVCEAQWFWLAFTLSFTFKQSEVSKSNQGVKRNGGEEGNNKIGQVNGLPGNGMAVYHLVKDFILKPLDFATELVLQQTYTQYCWTKPSQY